MTQQDKHTQEHRGSHQDQRPGLKGHLQQTQASEYSELKELRPGVPWYQPSYVQSHKDVRSGLILRKDFEGKNVHGWVLYVPRKATCWKVGLFNQVPWGWRRCDLSPELMGWGNRKKEISDQGPGRASSTFFYKIFFYWTFQEEFIPCLVNLELWAWLRPQTGDYGNLERKY